MKVVSVSPELIRDMIESYRESHPDHKEGELDLHIATNSWRHFQKAVGWVDGELLGTQRQGSPVAKHRNGHTNFLRRHALGTYTRIRGGNR